MVVAEGSDGVRAKVLVVKGLRKQKGREKERKTQIPLKKRGETCDGRSDLLVY